MHTDHLGMPRKMTDDDQAVVWDASHEPFGQAGVTAQPHFENPLRFPGQHFDAETGTHQNWHRDYDPGLGRYLQSDPIGLDGGLNTYGYAFQNPLSYSDPDGRHPAAVAIGLFCLRNPRACGAAAAAVITLIRNTIDPPAIPAPSGDACEDEPDCEKEIEDCSELCSRAQTDPDRRHVYGGSISQCMKNCLSEECGGEPKWKGFR